MADLVQSIQDKLREETFTRTTIGNYTQNDIAVMKAYGFNIKEMSEVDCVTELMRMYEKLINQKYKND